MKLLLFHEIQRKKDEVEELRSQKEQLDIEIKKIQSEIADLENDLRAESWYDTRKCEE